MRSFRPLRHSVLACTAALLIVLTGACSSGESEPEVDPDAPAIVQEEEATEAEATAEAELTSPRFEGEIIDKRALQPGDCFNDYTWRDRAGTLQQATTRVTCDKPHEGQLFLAVDHPAPEDQPYVTEKELESYTQEICYEQFEDWVGRDYEQSELEIGVLFPTLTSWGTEPFDREVSCYVFAYNGGLLRGSMKNTGL